jgi:hypothetical protein
VQSTDVTAYGCDYSAREFEPWHLNNYPDVRIEWLARYIGYPWNPKCISHYPGAYRAHRDAGRPVVLYHQIGYQDFEGGFQSGVTHAQIALADAKSQGWNGETPIVAAFDRRMPQFTRNGVTYRAIPLAEVREYMRGFVSVIGYGNAGFYGFEDTMGPCVAENWVRFRMQCGARSAHINGITAWQENNVQPYLLGTQTDRLELYIPLGHIGGNVARISEEEMGDLLVRSHNDPTVYVVSWTADGYWKRQVGDGEALLLQASGVPVHFHNQVDVDNIPTRAEAARALWNYKLPTGRKNEDGEDEYLQAFEVLRDISLAVAGAVADVDEEALAAALKAQGVQLGGATPAQVKAALAEVLRSVPAQGDAQA